MELHALNRVPAMAQPHDDPCAVSLMRFCANLQFAGQSFFRHDERVVSGGRHGLWHVFKQRFAVMLNKAGFAVHELTRTDNVAAKSSAKRLMSQAHSQHRTLTGKMLDEINADPCLLRRAGARRNKNMAG